MRTQLGKTGLEISRVVFGSMGHGNASDDQSRIRVVHAAIDARGVAVDLPLARLLLAVDRASAAAEVAEATRLTGGQVTADTVGSPVQLVAWLKSQGVKVDNAQAPTMRAVLELLRG